MYAETTSPAFHEEAWTRRQRFRNHYERAKFEAEKHVRGACVVPYIVFRPSIIMAMRTRERPRMHFRGITVSRICFLFSKNGLCGKMAGGSFFARKALSLLGSEYKQKRRHPCRPWLVLPCPSNSTVDMVPVDYVVESMVRGANNPVSRGRTVHLTNPNPPLFEFGLSSAIDDLGYLKVKYIKVPPSLFRLGMRVFYYIFFPLRAKIRSAMWYLPYVAEKHRFSHDNSRILGLSDPPPITRDF